ncbi:hypothetical protein C6M98_08415 [Corynebacterium diphtheriae]|nr:hypothetical protein A6J36_11910 [Corynebacterium diphtheriae]PTN68418.1 hypothetical protein C6M98_08415 [Corynebacterium diphtheriae]
MLLFSLLLQDLELMNAKTAGRENHPKLSSCGFRVLGFEFSPVCYWVFCDLRKQAARGGGLP